MSEDKLPSFDALKKQFKKELEGITNIEELKDVYAMEIARRDNLILHLQEQNRLLLASSIRAKQDELSR